MLMEVKNQLKVTILSMKYGLMREMVNKVSFLTNVIFMILNNSAFLIQWIILFSLKDNVGGYGLKEVFLLWGMAAGTYGFSHFLFKSVYDLSETINSGKLDVYIVQPKNILIQSITSSIEPSAFGDMLYAYIMLLLYGITPLNFLLFTLFIICGGTILVCIAIILGSLSFWFNRSDIISNLGNSFMTNFATYPDGIFKGLAKVLLYTIIPVAMTTYLPVKIIVNFNGFYLYTVLGITIVFIILSNMIFQRGLRRYSSSNLMQSRL